MSFVLFQIFFFFFLNCLRFLSLKINRFHSSIRRVVVYDKISPSWCTGKSIRVSLLYYNERNGRIFIKKKKKTVENRQIIFNKSIVISDWKRK